MKVDLQDQVALVTGAAGGIGEITSRLLAENGAIVVMTDLDEAKTQAAAAKIPRAHGLSMDVTNEKQVRAAIGWIVEKLGRLDIVINNAGTNTVHHRVTLDEFPVEEWDRIIDVDLRGLFLVSRFATEQMVKQGGGRVVNISSVLGVVPARLQCAFTAAKGAVVNLTRTMAIELATKGILVNCIAPGSTLTPATEALFYSAQGIQAEKRDQLLAHIPLGRPGKAEEIANSILFLCAPESSYITGQILCVDGGWTAGGFLRDF